MSTPRYDVSMVRRSLPVVVCLALLLCFALALPASADNTTRSAMMYLIAHSVGGFESFTPPATPTHLDVPLDYPTYAEIEYCTALGICSGYEDGTFHPGDSIGRDQGSVFVAREKAGGDANVPDPVPGTQTFLDVPPDSSAWKYIEYDAANGVYGDIGGVEYFWPGDLLSLCDAEWWCENAMSVDVDRCSIPVPPEPRGSVAGVVLDSELMLPLAGADVVVCGPSWNVHTTSGEDGTFSFPDLIVGWYTACTHLSGYSGIQSGVEVFENEVSPLTLYMSPLPTGSLEGVVRDLGRLFPVPGADVMVCGPFGPVHTTSGEDGTFSFGELTVGGYTGCAQLAGYSGIQSSVWVYENMVNSMTLYMESQTWIEDDSGRISYTGSWFRQKSKAASGGHLTYSGQPGAYLQFGWYGSGLTCYFAKGPMMGKARVRVDGNYLGVTDLYSPTKQLTQIGRKGLVPGSHEIVIEVTGMKNWRSTDVLVDLDAFEVMP